MEHKHLRLPLQKDRPTHVLVWPDVHVPHQDHPSVLAALKYARHRRWDAWICLGDFVDGDSVSSHSEGQPRILEGKRLAYEYRQAEKLLGIIQDVVRERNQNATMIYLEGNHENRVERYLDAHPEMEGLIEPAKHLRLAEQQIEWVPSWTEGTLLRVGHATFLHGHYLNKYHAEKMVNYYGTNIYYAHTHTFQVFTRILHGKDKILQAASLGCLCADQEYMQRRPDSWVRGFAEFWFLPDGTYTWAFHTIVNGRFTGSDGRVYDGNRRSK